jgi:hypothetical protein
VSPDDLEKVNWKGDATYRVLSHSFEVRWNSDPIGDYVRSVLEPFAVSSDPWERRSPLTRGTPPTYFVVQRRPSNDARYELLFGDESAFETMIRSSQLTNVLTHLFWHINSEATQRTGDFLLIHAGAVVTPSGDGVLLPAPSGSGKTTLVAGLVRGGFSYLSDEAGVIEPVTGMVHPYPKALTLKRSPLELFPDLVAANGRGNLLLGPLLVRPEELGPGALGKPSEVRLVVAPRYQEGARTELAPMSRAAGVVELCENILNLPLYRSRALPLLARVVARARCYRLVYGDLVEGVQAIERLTRQPARSATPIPS